MTALPQAVPRVSPRGAHASLRTRRARRRHSSLRASQPFHKFQGHRGHGTATQLHHGFRTPPPLPHPRHTIIAYQVPLSLPGCRCEGGSRTGCSGRSRAVWSHTADYYKQQRVRRVPRAKPPHGLHSPTTTREWHAHAAQLLRTLHTPRASTTASRVKVREAGSADDGVSGRMVD